MSKRNSNCCKLSKTSKTLWPRSLKVLIKKTSEGLKSRWSSLIREFREKVLEAKMNSKTSSRASCSLVKFLHSWLRNSMKSSEDQDTWRKMCKASEKLFNRLKESTSERFSQKQRTFRFYSNRASKIQKLKLISIKNKLRKIPQQLKIQTQISKNLQRKQMKS